MWFLFDENQFYIIASNVWRLSHWKFPYWKFQINFDILKWIFIKLYRRYISCECNFDRFNIVGFQNRISQFFKLLFTLKRLIVNQEELRHLEHTIILIKQVNSNVMILATLFQTIYDLSKIRVIWRNGKL